MTEPLKAPTGVDVVFKEGITRKEDRELQGVMLGGVKSTQQGKIDQASIAGNVEKLKDLLVLTWVDKYDGEKMSREVLEKINSKDFYFCHAEAEKRQTDLEEKKS